MQKPAEVERQWQVVDVKGKILGHVATEIAEKLMGKNKPTYTPHVDAGDYVVVINAAQVELSRNKAEKKVYRWHTGYPGGLKERSFKEMMEINPAEVIRHAVNNMLPKNKQRSRRLARLKIYADDQHEHQSQINATKK